MAQRSIFSLTNLPLSRKNIKTPANIAGRVVKDNLTRESLTGFTLIEILVVIGMIAILATIVIIAINPSRQFKQGRDTQRLSNANAILNAIGQRMADNKGTFAGAVSGTSQICPTVATGTDLSIYNGSIGSATSAVDLSCLTPTYIPSFPSDPTAASGNDTGYIINIDSNGRVTIKAPATEMSTGTPISVTR